MRGSRLRDADVHVRTLCVSPTYFVFRLTSWSWIVKKLRLDTRYYFYQKAKGFSFSLFELLNQKE